MRGKVSELAATLGASGITPAYAGKSRPLTQPGGAYWDHPRVCGEKKETKQKKLTKKGSPPRMRGKARL